jgi:molybdopterin synthase sulfur carrier subunit
MKIKVLCFGITREIIGEFEVLYEVAAETTLFGFLEKLKREFPRLSNLKSLRVAVNEEYAENDRILFENMEIVLIPPVSGG